MSAIPENSDLQLLKTGDVASLVRLSERTITRLVQKGEFPSPMKVGRTNLWQRSIIVKWMKAHFGS